MTDDRLRITRRLEAAPDVVFAALLDPEALKVWLWAGYGPADFAEVDPRPGGRYEVRIDARDGKPPHGMVGLYVDVDPPRRLAMTMRWESDVVYNRDAVPLDEVVIFELAPDGEGTALTFQRLGFPPDPKAVEAHTAGDGSTLDHLARYLSGE